MEPPRRTASSPAAALRTLLLGAVACACSEPPRPPTSAPAATTGSTPSAPASHATTAAPQASATAPPMPAQAPEPTAPTGSAPPAPVASAQPASLPDSCLPARGLRRSTLKGERRDASGVAGCVDAVDGHCCGPAGGGMACARPFDRGTTLRLRAAGHAGVCCYAMGGNEICEGRPLYVDGVLRRAALRSRADWS